MSAGFIVNGQCLDQNLARSVVESQNPLHVEAGAITYESHLVWDSASSFFQLKTYATDTVTTVLHSVSATNITYPACDTTDSFFDGLAMGWAVVAAMALAWTIHFLRRAL